jgi:enoyl-CoA hydratase/carnithine racemase
VSGEEPVRTERDGSVLELTIDRPDQRNAVNPAVNRALLAALAEARDDDGVHAVVLTGAGEKAFCAGGDLGGMRPDAGAVGQHRDRALFADVLRGLADLPKPVVARVNGHALAGGFGLALACDLLVAADHAHFGTTEVKLGMWPYMITAIITDHLGPKRTLELMLTGERIDAATAREWGLANRVVPSGELDDAVAELTGRLTSLSPVVLSLGKESYAAAARMRRDDALAYLASQLSLHLQTEDVAEGVAAFMEKRDPQWKGR